jgi:hypothetical protein
LATHLDASREDGKTVNGEIGVLRYVHANSEVSNKCYLVIDHENEKYVGWIVFDDNAFCARRRFLATKHRPAN